MMSTTLQRRAAGKSRVDIKTDSAVGARSPQPSAQPAREAERHMLIAQAAYFLAERRGFAPGCELEDWLAAEQEVNSQLSEQ